MDPICLLPVAGTGRRQAQTDGVHEVITNFSIFERRKIPALLCGEEENEGRGREGERGGGIGYYKKLAINSWSRVILYYIWTE